MPGFGANDRVGARRASIRAHASNVRSGTVLLHGRLPRCLSSSFAVAYLRKSALLDARAASEEPLKTLLQPASSAEGLSKFSCRSASANLLQGDPCRKRNWKLFLCSRRGNLCCGWLGICTKLWCCKRTTGHFQENDPLARPFTRLPTPAYYAVGAVLVTGLESGRHCAWPDRRPDGTESRGFLKPLLSVGTFSDSLIPKDQNSAARIFGNPLQPVQLSNLSSKVGSRGLPGDRLFAVLRCRSETHGHLANPARFLSRRS